MKKLFMFLAVAGLATFGTSCSSSDDSNPPVAEKQLTLTATPATVRVGESVVFAVTVDGKTEADAKLSIDGKEVSGLTQKFDKVGTYKVQAKKAGFIDSTVATVTVVAANVDILNMTGSKAAGEVLVGDNLSFTYTFNGTATTDGVQLLLNGTAITGNSYVAKAEDAGKTLKFTSKKGATVSNELVYTVKAAPVNVTSIVLSIVGDVNNLEAGTAIVFNLKDQNGGFVNGKLQISGQEFDFTDGVLRLNAPAGTYTTKAVFNTLTSNEISFTVKPVAPAVGAGTVVYNSTTYTVSKEFLGVIDADPDAGMIVWLSQTVTNDIIIQQTFITPGTFNEAGEITGGLPTTANVTPFSIAIYSNAGSLIESTANDPTTGEPLPSANLLINYNIRGMHGRYFDGVVASSATLPSAKTIRVNFTGDITEAQWEQGRTAGRGVKTSANKAMKVQKGIVKVKTAFAKK